MHDAAHNLRQAVEEGFKGMLVEAELPFVITRKNAVQDFQQIRPRVEVKCKIGATTGRRKILAGGRLAFDAWTFSLALQVVTVPQSDPASNVQHDAILARVRALCEFAAQASWTDVNNFPHHYIAEPLRSAGSEDKLQTDDGVEYSTLGYEGIVCVRDEAWQN